MNEVTKTPPAPLPYASCGDCIHAQPGPKTKDDVMARHCHRFPPDTLAVLTPQGIVIMSYHRDVRVETIACGEFDDGEDDESGMPTLAGNQSSGLTT